MALAVLAESLTLIQIKPRRVLSGRRLFVPEAKLVARNAPRWRGATRRDRLCDQTTSRQTAGLIWIKRPFGVQQSDQVATEETQQWESLVGSLPSPGNLLLLSIAIGADPGASGSLGSPSARPRARPIVGRMPPTRHDTRSSKMMLQRDLQVLTAA